MNQLNRIALILIACLLVACGSDAPTAPEPIDAVVTEAQPTDAPVVVEAVADENDASPTVEQVTETLSQITVPITIYMLDDDTDVLSSRRTLEEMDALIHEANTIWGAANIIFNIQAIERITVPNEVIVAVGGGYIGRFFEGIGTNYDLPNPSTINIFFSRETGGLDAINPANTRTIFVRDETTGDTARAIGRSLGHILNLHDIADTNSLMTFDGTGTTLTPNEITVARYIADGILTSLR